MTAPAFDPRRVVAAVVTALAAGGIRPDFAEAGPERTIRCRYLSAGLRGALDRCAGEAVDPDGELIICTRHLGRALELLNRRAAAPAVHPGTGRGNKTDGGTIGFRPSRSNDAEHGIGVTS